MSLAVTTAWRLADASGCPARCLISERDGRWQLTVWRGRTIVLSERCPTDDAALARANEIWQVMIDEGWTEPRH